MVQADICKYIILSDTDRKKGDLQYPHPNVVHRCGSKSPSGANIGATGAKNESRGEFSGWFSVRGMSAAFRVDGLRGGFRGLWLAARS